ncbi:MAG: PASTA domain-containing protein [Crocinitomicaceae bacterium]|nr:PASTA domain-containing protein [Crocinitomicaceae bacterium]
MWYLKSTTDFGESIEVPSFYKIHMDDLDVFVKDKELDYEIVDSVYMDGWPKGTVCWQYPKPTDSTGMSIKSGRTIQLSVVPESPQMVWMTCVKGQSKRMGETILQSVGIRTKVSYKPSPIGPGYIMEHNFNGKAVDTAGMFIPKGSRVELVVSKGKTGEATPLPSVVGLTIKDARQRFSSVSVSIHIECENCKTQEEIENSMITRQNPNGGPNVQVAAGTSVTLWSRFEGDNGGGTDDPSL